MSCFIMVKIVNTNNSVNIDELYTILVNIIIQNEGDDNEQDVCTD